MNLDTKPRAPGGGTGPTGGRPGHLTRRPAFGHPLPVGGREGRAEGTPNLVLGKELVWTVVSPPTRDDRDLMSALKQPHSEFRQVLSRSHHVRVKGLVEKKDFQRFGVSVFQCPAVRPSGGSTRMSCCNC